MYNRHNELNENYNTMKANINQPTLNSQCTDVVQNMINLLSAN